MPLAVFIVLAVLLASPAASADPACDPHVERALADHAMAGAATAFGIIRNPASGIAEPLPLLDFACGRELFDYRAYDIFFEPGGAMPDILGLAGRQVCEAAARAWRDALGRTPPRDIFRIPAPGSSGVSSAIAGGG